MTSLREYEKMSADQLLEQQKVLRENIKSGKTSFSSKAATVLKSVLFLGLATAVTFAGKAVYKGVKNDATDPRGVVDGTSRKMFAQSAMVGIGAMIPYAWLDHKKAVDRTGRSYGEELTHVERLLKEKTEALRNALGFTGKEGQRKAEAPTTEHSK
jgi:hypothetical protein